MHLLTLPSFLTLNSGFRLTSSPALPLQPCPHLFPGPAPTLLTLFPAFYVVPRSAPPSPCREEFL